MASSIDEASGIKLRQRQSMALSSDDLDDMDIAAYSADVEE